MSRSCDTPTAAVPRSLVLPPFPPHKEDGSSVSSGGPPITEVVCSTQKSRHKVVVVPRPHDLSLWLRLWVGVFDLVEPSPFLLCPSTCGVTEVARVSVRSRGPSYYCSWSSLEWSILIGFLLPFFLWVRPWVSLQLPSSIRPVGNCEELRTDRTRTWNKNKLTGKR